MQDTIEIEKGANYLATAQKVSEIIKALPISSEENDKLIAAILEHTEAGRLEAYQQGIEDAATAIEGCLSLGVDKGMNRYNPKKKK